MSYFGSHISSSKGYLAMGKQAVKLGADTFAFFTRNPRGGSVKPLDEKDIQAYLSFAEHHQFGPLVAHAPYTMNPAAAKEDLRIFAENAMREDLQRMEHIPNNYYNFHPGSHVGQGEQVGVQLIAEHLNRVLWHGMKTTVLLETMAGKGSEVGRSFEELAQILEQVECSEHMGVCLDTCHVWDAGYDIVNHLDDVLEEFDRIIGLNRLKALHVNDSMNERGARKDRHAKIGEGKIGKDAFERIVRHPALQDKSMVLETPNDDAGWAAEIALLRAFV